MRREEAKTMFSKEGREKDREGERERERERERVLEKADHNQMSALDLHHVRVI